jgi:hypothetical protein
MQCVATSQSSPSAPQEEPGSREALSLMSHVDVQGLRVFDKIPFLSGDWEKRAVEKHLGRKL